MQKYDAVVIGAGNGGLAAACRMAKGGKKTLLVERHNLPGGCASSFRRGRFEFETALHEICEWGSRENPGGCRKTCEEYGLDIPWRRLVGMAFHAGFEQHGDIGLAAGYFPGEVVLRENGGHDAQPVCCGRRFLCAGIACRQTGDGQHGYGQK